MMAAHDVLIFGGSGKTGRHLVDHALQAGLSVACLLRLERDASALLELGVTVIRGDAFELADCEHALQLAAPRAVVSLLGGKNAAGRRIDAIGNLNVIAAAQSWQSDLPFVLLTSLGCDEQFEQMPPNVQQALREALIAKTEAERQLRSSTLNWRIVRPGGLSDEAGEGRYSLVQSLAAMKKMYLSRSDAALATLDVLRDASKAHQVWTVLASDCEAHITETN
jgi:nucleoside-diphosphate-sugar epimerase